MNVPGGGELARKGAKDKTPCMIAGRLGFGPSRIRAHNQAGPTRPAQSATGQPSRWNQRGEPSRHRAEKDVRTGSNSLWTNPPLRPRSPAGYSGQESLTQFLVRDGRFDWPLFIPYLTGRETISIEVMVNLPSAVALQFRRRLGALFSAWFRCSAS